LIQGLKSEAVIGSGLTVELRANLASLSDRELPLIPVWWDG